MIRNVISVIEEMRALRGIEKRSAVHATADEIRDMLQFAVFSLHTAILGEPSDRRVSGAVYAAHGSTRTVELSMTPKARRILDAQPEPGRGVSAIPLPSYAPMCRLYALPVSADEWLLTDTVVWRAAERIAWLRLGPLIDVLTEPIDLARKASLLIQQKVDWLQSDTVLIRPSAYTCPDESVVIEGLHRIPSLPDDHAYDRLTLYFEPRTMGNEPCTWFGSPTAHRKEFRYALDLL